MTGIQYMDRVQYVQRTIGHYVSYSETGLVLQRDGEPQTIPVSKRMGKYLYNLNLSEGERLYCEWQDRLLHVGRVPPGEDHPYTGYERLTVLRSMNPYLFGLYGYHLTYEGMVLVTMVDPERSMGYIQFFEDQAAAKQCYDCLQAMNPPEGAIKIEGTSLRDFYAAGEEINIPLLAFVVRPGTYYMLCKTLGVTA